MQDLPPNPSGVLFAAVNENNDAYLRLRGEPDIGRGVVQSPVFVEDPEVAAADVLFVRSEAITVTDPLEVCTETINEVLVARAREMFANEDGWR